MIAEAALNTDNAKLLGWSNNMFKEYIKDGWTPNVYDREKGETKKESKDRIEMEDAIKGIQNGGDYIVDVNKGSALLAGGDGDKKTGWYKSFYFGFESNLLPVAKAVSGDLDLMGGTGSGGFIIIFQGPDAGKVVPFDDIGGGIAIDISANVKETNFWVTGDVSKFSIDALKGRRDELSVGVTAFHIDISSSAAISKERGPWGYVIGVSIGVGVGAIPWWISGGWNYGETKIYK